MSMEVYKRAKPYLAMILLQFGYASLGIIAKFGLNQGMSLYSFAVYRNVVAALVFAPFALLFERKVRPRMTTSVFLKIMLLGLLEPVIDQNLFYTGMKYTTATFATAMCNIVPAMFFLMACILRFNIYDSWDIGNDNELIRVLQDAKTTLSNCGYCFRCFE
ncbi:WAT1-related protein At2g39510-like isoform X2 [Camellia sinensis]|uniref:WAT1-related protein At2g39510-like isoform X2 n=1 Tax=Camellia sinensis TaxID=4442 RepID=UPI001036824E|nr:WAT1-related protein At2g39510-like isoform X2 [Camellia sinensis]